MSFFLDLLRCLLCCEYDVDRDYDDFGRIERNHFRVESPSSVPRFAHQSIDSFSNLYTRILLSKDKEVSGDSKFPPLLSASASASAAVSASPYNSHSSTPKPPKSFPKQAQSSYNYEPSKSLKPAISSSEQPQLSSCQTSSSSQRSSIKPLPSCPFSLNGPPCPSPQKLPNVRPILPEVASIQASPKTSRTTQSSASQTCPSPQSFSAKPSPSSFKVPETSTQPSPFSSSPLNAPPSRTSERLPTSRPILFVPSNQTSPKTSKTTQSSADQARPSPQCSSAKQSPSSIFVPKPSAQSFPSSPSLFSEPPSPSSSSSSSSQKFPTFKTILREATPNATDQKGKEEYICVEKDSLPLYMIPEDIKDLIKKEIVPEILKKPLSPLTYKDYFAALLYAEEYYYEKWSDFEMKNVTLELQKSRVSKRHKKHKNVNDGSNKPDDKIFVKFQIDSIPEHRPFLLSRDLVYARLTRSKAKNFQGVIFRVEGRKNIVLVEFEEDFYIQHDSTQRYDISFSFNRICLKRAHQALNAVSENLIQNFLFPDSPSRKVIPTTPVLGSQFSRIASDISSTVSQILSIQGSPPYLVAGPLCVPESKNYSYSEEPSKTGKVVREAVVQIYKSSPECRILISAPSNSACDVLMRSLKKVIPESNMFRANAAFREKEEVPDDILSSCLYKKERFACPSLDGLKKYRVIFSTFMSSFRLHNEGIHAGHFSHVFLVDASSAIEPEALVTVANFLDKNTTLVVTGRHGNSSRWIRSEIARERGLRTSYFERLCQCRPYRTLNPKFFTDLGLPDDSYSFR
ncbi:hypothetical protein FEM48_Zijuj07G0005600 [Ziziphus jujuba var. spinosa]|uniref:Helicase MOV-10-like beta-barrel domain-containing protein n=1 Tax=Ziziphus jujuba var. spinosa TaxID=714518 RepID=A0A978V1E4_ZIZJJ|nr:uncharacterized protein LOC107425569 [Ziziphus jujuba var. spinosa]KAH7521177.1 hypothetical protein FEM48_Zijuj07G0005600 [Ziziphus jujuba var. spinosa]